MSQPLVLTPRLQTLLDAIVEHRNNTNPASYGQNTTSRKDHYAVLEVALRRQAAEDGVDLGPLLSEPDYPLEEDD
jgi:hypothetical protein